MSLAEIKPVFKLLGLSAIGGKSPSLRSRVVTGVGLSVIGAIASRLLGLAASLAAARILGQTLFGQYSAVMGTVGMFGTFAGFGLGITATKGIAECRHVDNERAYRIARFTTFLSLITGVTMSLGMFALAPIIARQTLGEALLQGPLRVSVLALIGLTVNGAQLGVLAGFERFKLIVSLSVLQGVVNLAFTSAGALLGSAYGAVLGWSASQAISALIFEREIRMMRRKAKISSSWSDCFSERRLLRSSALPAALGSNFISPATWLGNALLAHSAGSWAQIALFNAALQWRVAILFVPGTIGSAILPIMSNMKAVKDLRLKALILYQIGGAAIVATLVAVPLILFAPSIMSAYGPAFRGGGQILSITCLSAIVVAVTNQISRTVASVGSMWSSCFFDLIAALTLAVFTIILVPKYSAIGLAYAYLSSSVLQCLVQLTYLFRSYRDIGLVDLYQTNTKQL